MKHQKNSDFNFSTTAQKPVSTEEGAFILEYANTGLAELDRGEAIPWGPATVERIREQYRSIEQPHIL